MQSQDIAKAIILSRMDLPSNSFPEADAPVDEEDREALRRSKEDLEEPEMEAPVQEELEKSEMEEPDEPSKVESIRELEAGRYNAAEGMVVQAHMTRGHELEDVRLEARDSYHFQAARLAAAR